MKRFMIIIAMLLALSVTAGADDKIEAEKVLKDRLDAVILILQEKQVKDQDVERRVITIVEPIFDFDLMAKLSLGKKHWPGLAEDKKRAFTKLFVERLKSTYIQKIRLYTDERIEYLAPVQTQNKVQVPTELISKNSKIVMLYKMYKSSDDWKIYDIEIEGVSIISTYRTQFDQVLTGGTIDDLLKKLAEPEEKPAQPARTS